MLGATCPFLIEREKIDRNGFDSLGTLLLGLTLAAYALAVTDVHPDQRGVISGMLSLSRNLGLIAGASVLGAVFAFASGTIEISTARPEAVAIGMRITFAVAAGLVVVALAIAVASRVRATRFSLPRDAL